MQTFSGKFNGTNLNQWHDECWEAKLGLRTKKKLKKKVRTEEILKFEGNQKTPPQNEDIYPGMSGMESGRRKMDLISCSMAYHREVKRYLAFYVQKSSLNNKDSWVVPRPSKIG